MRCPDCGGRNYRRNMDRRERELQRQRILGVGDPVRLLVHRIRSGTLPVEYVRRAAALGDPTSIKYVRGRGLEPWPTSWRGNEMEHLEYFRSILRFLPKNLMVPFAADAAERVLSIYEDQFTDSRPREAIEAARRWVEDPSDANRVRTAARSADAAANASFRRARHVGGDHRLAAFAAASAAFVAASQMGPVYFAARAAYDAALAAEDRDAEEDWQKQRLIQYLLGEVQV